MVRIIHVFDSSVISNSTIALFQKMERFDQTFIVIVPDKKLSENRKELPGNIVYLNASDDLSNQIRKEIEAYDIIFLQALSYEKAKAIASGNFKKKVFIWGLWGYDLYNFVQYQRKDFNEDYGNSLTRKRGLKERLTDYYTFNIVYKRAIKKIDICLFLLESDFNLLSGAISHQAQWMSACYQTIENINAGNKEFSVSGNGILIGNSSTPSNRHGLVLNILKDVDLKDRSVVVPLSYGDENYRKTVLEQGIMTFNNNFEPLLDFMKMEDYIKVLQKCTHTVMPHHRQQAFGSIVMMLLAGSKVYLSKSSPLYAWFKNAGIRLFSVEDDLILEIHRELSDEDKNLNKKILYAMLSEEVILKQIEVLLVKASEISQNRTFEKA